MHRPAVSEYMRMDPHWEQIRLLLLCKENIFLYDVVDTAPCQRSLASVAKKRSIYITLAISGFLSQIILLLLVLRFQQQPLAQKEPPKPVTQASKKHVHFSNHIGITSHLLTQR